MFFYVVRLPLLCIAHVAFFVSPVVPLLLPSILSAWETFLAIVHLAFD